MKKRKSGKLLPSIISLIFIVLIFISFFTLNPIKNNTPSKKFKWPLILVNEKNKLPDNFSVSLLKLSNGHSIDKKAYPDLQKMFDDMRNKGVHPKISSSYRTKQAQEKILKEKIDYYKSLNNSKKEATSLAEKLVALPGHSEHETGLALDVNSVNRKNNNKVYTWLKDNCYKYGFIIRYPKNKTHITGINYEPWHIRYVGKKAAKEIYTQKLCLEEYLLESY